jgi:hypothetical protein
MKNPIKVNYLNKKIFFFNKKNSNFMKKSNKSILVE